MMRWWGEQGTLAGRAGALGDVSMVGARAARCMRRRRYVPATTLASARGAALVGLGRGGGPEGLGRGFSGSGL